MNTIIFCMFVSSITLFSHAGKVGESPHNQMNMPEKHEAEGTLDVTFVASNDEKGLRIGTRDLPDGFSYKTFERDDSMVILDDEGIEVARAHWEKIADGAYRLEFAGPAQVTVEPFGREGKFGSVRLDSGVQVSNADRLVLPTHEGVVRLILARK